MTSRTSYDAVARAGTVAAARAQSRSTGSSRARTRRVLEVVGRAGTTSSVGHRASVAASSSAHDQRRDAAPAVVHRGAAERGRGRRRSPVNATTVSGPVTYANASSVITTCVGEAEQQRGAGHARADDGEQRRDDARRVGQRLGDAAPRVQRGDAFVDVGARRRDRARRSGCRARRRGAPRARWPRPRRCRSRRGACRPSRRNQLTTRPSMLDETRGGGARCGARDGRAAARGVTHGSAQDQRRVVPAEPERVREHRRGADRPRRSPDTTSSPMSSPICSRFAVGGSDAVAERQQRDAPPRRRRRRPIMWPVTPLVRRDRGRARRRTPCGSPRPRRRRSAAWTCRAR